MDTTKLAYIVIAFSVIGLITVLVLFVKLAIFAFKILMDAFYSPKIHEPVFDEKYYEQKHQKMREELKKADEYRKKHFGSKYD